jgi:hypothetical protein
MRNLRLIVGLVFVGLTVLVSTINVSAQRIVVTRSTIPILTNIEKVGQLPPEIPPRVGAMTFDRGQLWISIYYGNGLHARYDAVKNEWNLERDPAVASAIRKITDHTGPGGWAFVDGRLWLGHANKLESNYGWVDLVDSNQFAKLEKPATDEVHKVEKPRSRSFAGLTYDGVNIWASWHACDYDVPVGDTQRLLKVDRDTAEILESYPLPYGSPADGARGLAWDGTRLWYAYGSHLMALNRGGNVLAHYTLKGVDRTSGMAWDGESLWIAEFEGKLWRIHGDDLPINHRGLANQIVP